jgi:hypothetical protein
MDANQIMQTVTTIAIAFGLKVIRETFGATGFPVPEQHLVIRNGAGSAVKT